MVSNKQTQNKQKQNQNEYLSGAQKGVERSAQFLQSYRDNYMESFALSLQTAGVQGCLGNSCMGLSILNGTENYTQNFLSCSSLTMQLFI